MDHMTSSDQLGGSTEAPNEAAPAGGGSGGSMAFDSFEKIEVDFDNSDLGIDAMLDTLGAGGDAELDKLLAKESTQGVDAVDGLDVDLDQLGIQEAMLSGNDGEESVSSMDRLLSMNIIEVEDGSSSNVIKQEGHNSDLMKEFAQGFLSQDGAPSGGVDPLLGSMSGGQQPNLMQANHHQQQQMMIQAQLQQQQQQQQQQQMMQMQAMMQNNTIAAEEEEALTVEKVSQLANMGSVDLELEKMKLLNRLQEINSRQGGVGVAGGNHPPMMMQPVQSNGLAAAGVGGASTGVASVMGSSGNAAGGAGETPLSAFLRNKNKGATSSGVAATAVTASLLAQNVPDAPASASILDAAPMDYGATSNPFLRKTNSRNSLMGAMNKSSSSQNMVRKTLSGRNLTSSVTISAVEGKMLHGVLLDFPLATAVEEHTHPPGFFPRMLQMAICWAGPPSVPASPNLRIELGR
ncbi:MAG: hypothetical protein SGARI_000683 [Bacillariaceae sp.]